MKKLYLNRVIWMILMMMAATSVAFSQCPVGSAKATINWDNLDYLTRLGTYNAFVSDAMVQQQAFAMGRNKATINITPAINALGETTNNTAEVGSNGTGADLEFSGGGTITIKFDTVVHNLTFSLYDIDATDVASITAVDQTGTPLNITMTLLAAGVINIAGSGTPVATATSNGTVVPNTDTRGTLNISIAGNSPAAAKGIKAVTITITGGDYFISDLSACVYGSFPLNYYAAQQPFIGQPAYYLVTPDNNSVYLFNPLSGKADWLFSEPNSPWVNSMAYDHVNKFLYYVMDHSTPLATNRSLKKYDFNTETISTIVPDLRTLGIPLFDIVVESAGAAFYNGSLYLGIEGTNGAKNSRRESIIWRIDFDATQNPISATQAFAFPADNGSGLLTHDWGDFTIKDGVLYDFNTGNSGSTSAFIHYNLQTGIAVNYNTNGAPAPIQAGQTWNGRLYWTGGQYPEGGRVSLYNENGTIGPKIPVTVSACSPGWVGRAGDASDPFRPKSDFGDAPASYDPIAMDKATHEYDCNLRLGLTYDREWDKTPSNATSDGTDEDGIATVSSLRRGTFNYVQDVTVYNNTGANATLVGWLDYNGNGVFEPLEGLSLVIPSSNTLQTHTLSWNAITVTLPLATTTYMRIRVTSATNNMTVNNPTRWYSNGEVEDYPVFVNVLLPVELHDFNANAKNNNSVVLDWQTGKELDFDGFEIERSKDGLHWNYLTFVDATNNIESDNNYVLTDSDPVPGKSFYRLKLVSKDGNFRYSEVRSVMINDVHGGLKILPNPVRSATMLRFTHNVNETAMINVIDINGKRMLSRPVVIQSGMNEILLDKLNLTPGIYVLQVVMNERTMNSKMIVQ